MKRDRSTSASLIYKEEPNNGAVPTYYYDSTLILNERTGLCLFTDQ